MSAALPDGAEIRYQGAHYHITATNTHRTRRGVSVSSMTLLTVSTDPAKSTTQKFVSYPTPSQVADSPQEIHGVISHLGVPQALMTPPAKLGTPRAPLLVGYDAEWQIVDGRRQILSLQMSVRCSDGRERVWVLWHRKNTRFALSTLMGWFLADLAPHIDYRDYTPVGGKKQDKGKSRKGREPAYLVTMAGHYSIVDLSVVYDRAKILRKTDSLRRTLASVEKPVYSEVWSEDRNRSRKVVIHFRDTMLLAPAGSSVEKLGDAMQFSKLVLPDGYGKSEMGRLRAERPDAFIAYAARDAEITRRWIEMTTGPNSIVPVTLGGQAALILREAIVTHRDWDRTKFDFEWRGLATTAETYRDEGGEGSTLRRRKVQVPRPEALMLLTAASHAYYGGRNEGFLFGVHHSPHGWSDYDLAGAYPTAMALIDDPDYSAAPIAMTGTLRLGAWLQPNSWFFGHIRFRFPVGTMYPCLPCKDPYGRGLIFPLRGETWASAPEIRLALQIGCEVELTQPALLLPTTGDYSLREGMRGLLGARREAEQTYGKKSVQALAAKERANSAYGKLAQGLAGKRAYSTRHDQTRPIPMSPVTSAPQAALTTGLVRAVVSAAMIQLHELGYSTASVTTDGFLTDAPSEVLYGLDLFGLKKGFEDARRGLVGSETIWELKHRSRSLVMLKTRGGFGIGQIDAHALPVAGAGYKVSGSVKDRVEQIGKPAALAELFLARKGRIGFEFHALPSPREYVQHDADAVGKDVSKQISWEWDYKREPVNERMESIEIDGTRYNHVSYATRPWGGMAEFENARAATDDLREPVVDEGNVVEIRGRIARRPAAKEMGLRVRGKLPRAHAISILRGLRSGLLTAPWFVPGITGRQVCKRVGEVFGVELGLDDWKNAGRADRSQKALFIGLGVEMVALRITVSTAPAVKTAAAGAENAA